ncbi:MAG: hypothetical protein Q8L68_07560 [Methylococcales bacterium]|nr:hypothetical protein [Methylococcales bacterium]
MPNNTCSEQAVSFAAKKTLGFRIQFNFDYPEERDLQIDLSQALATDTSPMLKWYSGNSCENFVKDLQKLNIKKCYLLRTGTHGGAGHFQVLYFDESKKGWLIENRGQISCEGKLTTYGTEYLISPRESWGQHQGQRSFCLFEATEAPLVRAAYYIHDFRQHGDDVALVYLFQALPPQKLYLSLLRDTWEQAIKDAPYIKGLTPEQKKAVTDLQNELIRHFELLAAQPEAFFSACKTTLEKAMPFSKHIYSWRTYLAELLLNFLVFVGTLGIANCINYKQSNQFQFNFFKRDISASLRHYHDQIQAFSFVAPEISLNG